MSELRSYAVFCRDTDADQFEVVRFQAESVEHAMEQFYNDPDGWPTPREVMVEIDTRPTVSHYDIAVYGRPLGPYYAIRRVTLNDRGEATSIEPASGSVENEIASLYRWDAEDRQWSWQEDFSTVHAARIAALEHAGTDTPYCP